MGFDQNVVTQAISQGNTPQALAAPEVVYTETKPFQSSRSLSGSIGNIGALGAGGTVSSAATTLPMTGSAFFPSTPADTVTSPMNFLPARLATQGQVVPLSTASARSPSGSIRYAKVLSGPPKLAQETFQLAPRTVSAECVTISRENTLTNVQELPESRTPLDQSRIASNLPQSSMEEIRSMMHELRQDFTALQTRVNALPGENGGGTPSGILDAVEAEKKERRREMGELAAYVNTALAEIRAQAAVFSDRLTTAGDPPATVQGIEEPERLESIVKNLLRPERDARAEIATSLEAERAGRVQDLNNERDARVREMDEVRLSIGALSDKFDGHGQNQEAMAGADEELLRRLAEVEAQCNQGQRELEASLVDLQAQVAEHRECTREVETGLIQGLAGDIAALKEQGASIDALHCDVEVLQASAVNTAELLLEAQQELRNVQQSSDSDVKAEHGYHADFVESNAAQLSDLEAARINHANTVESHKTQLGQLEAAHTSHAQIADMHGSKLSSLEAAHGDHATKVESHGAQLSELAKAHEFHLGAVEMHRTQLTQLEAAHGEATGQLSSLKDAHSHHANLMESHKTHLSELEAAHSSHASIVDSQGSKLSSLEAAHGQHATIFESHGNQLSSLTDAHSHHTSIMDSHKVQLRELETAHSSHASIAESQRSKLSSLEAAHGHHATIVESHGAQLGELATAQEHAHSHHTSILESHKVQLSELEAAHSSHASIAQSQESKLSSLEAAHGHHATMVETYGTQLSELVTAHDQLRSLKDHHASTLESLQHQVNSVPNLEQLVSRLSADMDVIRQRQQDSNRSSHESHEFAGRFGEQTALMNELRSKINKLEVSSAESAELHQMWTASHQELHQAHSSRASALEDSHAQHRGDLETLQGQVELLRSLDERMGCLILDMEALKQRLPAESNPEVVGHLEDPSVMDNTDYKEAGTAECASNTMEAAATKIQCSARGRMARKQVAERREEANASERASIEIEAAVTKIQRSARGRLARRRLADLKAAMVSGEGPLTELQETDLGSATVERQVTGSDQQSVTGAPQAQRSWWRRLTSPGLSGSQTPISPHDAKPLQFTILGAKGLKVADWTHGEGKSDPYCICELKGKSKASKTQTQVIYHNLDPIWNHTATFNDYVVGDSLLFTIFDVDYIPLGSLVLPSEKFHPHGFEGELPLEDAGEDGTAVLSLKIEPLVDIKDDPASEAAGEDWDAEY